MTSLLSFLSYPILAALSVSILLCVGYGATLLLRAKPRLHLSLVLGLVLWVAGSWLTLLTGQKLQSFSLIYISLAVLALVLSFIRGHLRNIHNKPKITFERVFSPVVFSLFVSTWIFVPSILSLAEQNVFGGYASIANNDLASYAMVLKQILRTGLSQPVGTESVITNFDLSWLANRDHTGSFLFMGVMTGIFDRNFWFGIYPSMLGAVAILWLSLYRLTTNLFPRITVTKFSRFVPPTVALLLPLSLWTLNNDFLGQTLAMAAIVGAGSSLYSTIFKKRQENSLSEGLLWATFGVLVYPPIAFISLTIGIVLMVFSAIRLMRFRTTGTAENTYLMIFSLSIFSMSAALNFGTILTWVTGVNTASTGWPMQSLSMFGALFYPADLFVHKDPLFEKITWALFFVVLIFCSIFMRNVARHIRITFLGLSVSFLLGWLYFVIKSEWLQYPVWKFASYFLPILAAIFVAMLLQEARERKSLYLVAFTVLGMLTPAALFFVPGQEKIVTSGIRSLSNDLFLASVTEINLDFGPYFETMSSVTYIPTRTITINPPNYFERQINERTCSLVRISPAVLAMPGARFLNENYAVIPVPHECLFVDGGK